jgi:hypothetical protein
LGTDQIRACIYIQHSQLQSRLHQR